MFRLRTALLALAFPLLLAACGDQDTPAKSPGPNDTGTKVTPSKPLKVGVILPMTGGQADFGKDCWDGIQLAHDELAATNSLKVPLDLLRRDEQSKPEQAGQHAKSLVDTASVHVIIGTVASGSTRKVFQECKEAGVPGITPASTNDKITVEGGPFCSRICFKDSFQGAVLAQFALSQGWKKAAVAEDKSAPYAVGLSENFRKTFEAGGGTVAREFYQEGDKDFSNLIQNVAGSSPDVVVIAGYYTEGGLMLRQAQGHWDGKPVIGGDGFDGEGLIKLAGEVKNEIFFTSHFAADDPDPGVQAFVTRFKARFGRPPGAMSALGYDSIFVLNDALGRAKDPYDRKQIAAAIAATKGLKVVTGVLDLTTPDRTPVKDAVVLKVDGGFKHFKTISAK